LVNDYPVIPFIDNQSTNEDTPVHDFPITVTDIETSDCDLGLTIVSSDETIISLENITYWCDSNIRYFSFTPTTNMFGNVTITLTASDDGNLTTSRSFDMMVNAVNDRPLIGSIVDQSTNEDIEIVSIPLTATDIETDTCDMTLSFGATDTNLISVRNIAYECISDTFYVSLTNAYGHSFVSITVTDAGGLNRSTSFEITVTAVNDPPTLANPLDDQNTVEDDLYEFTIPGNTFNDVDLGDFLTYESTLDNGSPLPSWLSFNASTLLYSGTPTNDEVGSYTIKVVAKDTSLVSIVDYFVVTVDNTNDTPTLENPISDQSVNEDSLFDFTFIETVFNDVDAGDSLTYEAKLESGAALPSWLSFNASTRTFSGI